MTLKEQKKKMNSEQLTNWNILEQAQYKDVCMLRLNVYFASLQADKLKRPCMHFPTSSNYAHLSLKHSHFSVLKVWVCTL